MDGKPSNVPSVLCRAWLRGAVIPHLQITASEYGAMLMEGLGVMGARGKQVNGLQHLMGYLKNHLPAHFDTTTRSGCRLSCLRATLSFIMA